MTDFDKACLAFTKALKKAANWKQVYLGAAYTTRLFQAILEARDACDNLEAELGRLGEFK